jgi:imidazolonepropionase-like amidohydrolase
MRLTNGGNMREETLVIDNVAVLPGDGTPVQPNRRIVISHGIIQEIGGERQRSASARLVRVIDGTGMIATPGIINMHSHVITYGPRLRGEAPYPVNHVAHHLWRHLVYGTTTILSVDGYVLPAQAAVGMQDVPIKIKSTTLHTPKNIEAGRRCHLEFTLSPEQEHCTVERAIEQGAVAIGQVGGVLAILNMCYEQIPDAVFKVTGQRVGPVEGRKMLECTLGMHVDESVYEPARVESVLEEIGLADFLKPPELREIIHRVVLPVHEISIEATYESAEIAKRLGIPVLLSNNSITQAALRDVSKDLGGLLIALHSNHPSFERDEAIRQAEYLKANGNIVEISTGDHLGLRRMFTSSDLTREMLARGLVDLLSTDHTGGYFEPILRVIEWMAGENIVALENAITLGTRNPMQAISRLAPNCGVLEIGRVADIALVNERRVSEVIAVVSDGKLVLGPLGLNR